MQVLANRRNKEYTIAQKLMGNIFEITVVTDSDYRGHNMLSLAITEIQRIEALLSTYRSDSLTNQINENAGIGHVEVPPEFFDLVLRSLRISQITDGAFDITYGSLDKRLWNFDRSMKSLPTKRQAADGVRLINYRNIILNHGERTIMLKEKGMRIGFGGIGKGYAAETVRALLKAAGVAGGIINASGDLATWGTRANMQPWTVGISHPDYANYPFSHLDVSELAMATSGNYEKYVIIDNIKYSHTINPKTGLPITGIKSVTVFCANAELADAMTTPVAIMGVTTGLKLINQISGIECIIIDDDNNIYKSKNIQLS